MDDSPNASPKAGVKFRQFNTRERNYRCSLVPGGPGSSPCWPSLPSLSPPVAGTTTMTAPATAAIFLRTTQPSTTKPRWSSPGDMDVNSLDPQRAYCDTCQIYLTAVYETLIGLDHRQQDADPAPCHEVGAQLPTRPSSRSRSTRRRSSPTAGRDDRRREVLVGAPPGAQGGQPRTSSSLISRSTPATREVVSDAQIAPDSAFLARSTPATSASSTARSRWRTAPGGDGRPGDRQGRAVVPVQLGGQRTVTRSSPTGWAELRLTATTTTGARRRTFKDMIMKETLRRSPSASCSRRARPTSPCRSPPTSPEDIRKNVKVDPSARASTSSTSPSGRAQRPTPRRPERPTCGKAIREAIDYQA